MITEVFCVVILQSKGSGSEDGSSVAREKGKHVRKESAGERKAREKGKHGRKESTGERKVREKGKDGRKERTGERKGREKGKHGRKGSTGERKVREKGKCGRKESTGESKVREKGKHGRKLDFVRIPAAACGPSAFCPPSSIKELRRRRRNSLIGLGGPELPSPRAAGGIRMKASRI
jgi:hypothetical protein